MLILNPWLVNISTKCKLAPYFVKTVLNLVYVGQTLIHNQRAILGNRHDYSPRQRDGWGKITIFVKMIGQTSTTLHIHAKSSSFPLIVTCTCDPKSLCANQICQVLKINSGKFNNSSDWQMPGLNAITGMSTEIEISYLHRNVPKLFHYKKTISIFSNWSGEWYNV